MSNHIVANLDVHVVTWASAFCAAAKQFGWDIISEPEPGLNIFIGDNIDWEATSKIAGRYIYFLARFEGSNQELLNIIQADVCIVPSTQERLLVAQFLGQQFLQTAVEVRGFPISHDRLASCRKSASERVPKSVAFVGVDDPVKDPELEMDIVSKLAALGYKCYHLSPFAVSHKQQFERLGTQVIEFQRGAQYLDKLSSMEYVICTSERESLYISGIEAAYLEVSTLLPYNEISGYNDWCDPKSLYAYKDADAAVELLLSTPPSRAGNVTLKYDDRLFFNSLEAEPSVQPH